MELLGDIYFDVLTVDYTDLVQISTRSRYQIVFFV